MKNLFVDISPQLALIICAQLMSCIARANELTVMVKSNGQRTEAEREQVSRGLVRSFWLEFLILVPASSVLMMLLFAPLIPRLMVDRGVPIHAAYSALGVASYGFPFSGIKQWFQRTAANILKEFASITSKGQSEDLGGRRAEGGAE